MPEQQSFTAVLTDGPTGGFVIELPFDANLVWGDKPIHHIAGTVSGVKVRGPLTGEATGYQLRLGQAWRRDAEFVAGEQVEVVLWAEGPQAEDLPEDFRSALGDAPEAFAFWQGLATFYRKGYLTWLKGAQRRPAVRAQRVDEVVGWLKAGIKQRPRSGAAGTVG